MYCSKCGSTVPDGTTFCTNCGSSMNQNGQQYQNTYQQPYGFQQPYGTQPNFAYANALSEIDSANTLGIIAMVAAFFIPLVSWICGGIGMDKANPIKYQNYPDLVPKAEAAKKKCLTGIIMGVAIPIIWTILYFLIFVVIFANF